MYTHIFVWDMNTAQAVNAMKKTMKGKWFIMNIWVLPNFWQRLDFTQRTHRQALPKIAT
jgi:hypothetical protein